VACGGDGGVGPVSQIRVLGLGGIGQKEGATSRMAQKLNRREKQGRGLAPSPWHEAHAVRGKQKRKTERP